MRKQSSLSLSHSLLPHSSSIPSCSNPNYTIFPLLVHLFNLKSRQPYTTLIATANDNYFMKFHPLTFDNEQQENYPMYLNKKSLFFIKHISYKDSPHISKYFFLLLLKIIKSLKNHLYIHN